MGWCRYGATKCSKKATKEKKIDHRKNKKREKGGGGGGETWDNGRSRTTFFCF